MNLCERKNKTGLVKMHALKPVLGIQVLKTDIIYELLLQGKRNLSIELNSIPNRFPLVTNTSGNL